VGQNKQLVIAMSIFLFLLEMFSDQNEIEIIQEQKLEHEFENANLESPLPTLGVWNDNDDGGLQINKLKTLSKAQLKPLLITSQFILGLESCLIRHKYVPAKMREYICHFTSVLLGEGHQDHLALMEIFGKTTSELPYIRTEYRERFWKHFQQWKDNLLKISYLSMTEHFFLNGQLNERSDFIIKLRQFEYIHSIRKAEDSFDLEIYGSRSKEDFLSEMVSFPDDVRKVRYTEVSIMSDDSDPRSEDKIEPFLVDIPHLQRMESFVIKFLCPCFAEIEFGTEDWQQLAQSLAQGGLPSVTPAFQHQLKTGISGS
jgi:hypothetical protein